MRRTGIALAAAIGGALLVPAAPLAEEPPAAPTAALETASTTVTAGQPLTLDSLNALCGELYDAYTPDVEVDDAVRITWGRVPHFYRAFYVYQYATGLSAAITLARALRDEGAAAQERYLGLLAAGGSDYPLELLRRAGVDLTSPEPVRVALAEFERVVAEMEKLVEEGALAGTGEAA